MAYSSQGLTPGIQYKVNITAIVEDTNQAKIESKALHGKVKHHSEMKYRRKKP